MWIGLGLSLVAQMSAVCAYGKRGKYDLDRDDWTEYVEQMKHFFSANDTEEEPKKKAILLSSCGTKTYSLIGSFSGTIQTRNKNI